VDLGGVGAQEPLFSGEQRPDLVRRLLAEFNEVSQSGTPPQTLTTRSNLQWLERRKADRQG
jgi:hypothetical protein